MNKTETRNLVTNDIEIRELEDGSKTIKGYAVKWEMKSNTMGYFKRFKEQFVKGAFTDTLRNDDQVALWSHDTSKVLGRTKNQTLRLYEDDIGLRFEMDLPNTTIGNDAYESIKRRDVEGVSFAFVKQDEKWDESDLDNITRTIHKAKLIEVSPVAFPAYPDSEVTTRSRDPYQIHLDEKRSEKRKRLYLQTLI